MSEMDELQIGAGTPQPTRYERLVQEHQHTPTGDGPVILDYAVRHADAFAKAARGRGNPSLADSYTLVWTALVARAEMGKSKHGTYLRASNGRNAAVDLFQEVLDAIMYAEQCDVEIKATWEADNLAVMVPELAVGANTLTDLLQLAARLAPYIEKAGA